MSEDAQSPKGALSGLPVVPIEQAVADEGARVIKIERPDGESARHDDATVAGMSAYFVWFNRGKESTALDLESNEDLALLHRLVAKADVLVQNLAPGAIDRLGAQIAWGGLTEVRDLGAHPALPRMPVRLPNGSQIRVPRPAGRAGPPRETPSVPAGADTGRIRVEFAR
jgi:CoA-transferase family III